MDAWDILGFVSAVAILGGVVAIYWPAALILGGGAGLTLYYFAERRRDVP